MNHVEKNGESFPSNFDFNFYFKGLFISMDIDHNVTLTKTLWVLYKTMQFYPFEQRNHIINEFLRRYFYKLMFHWCYNVREMFYVLLFY
jgi:hypothetical protein